MIPSTIAGSLVLGFYLITGLDQLGPGEGYIPQRGLEEACMPCV